MVKKIHCCWYGTKELPPEEKAWAATWRQHFPDWELVVWNESNTDLDRCAFARQAYDRGQYAFVSDYVRTKVLYEEGGLYLDTDVEILNNFQDLLGADTVLGFEGHIKVGTAVMYAPPGDPLLGQMLRYYETRPFADSRGRLNTTANTVILTDLLLQQGLKQNGRQQKVGGAWILPREYFYPKKTGEQFRVTGRTVAIHHFSGQWLSPRERRRGTNPLWIHGARPVLQTCRKLGIRLLGTERVYQAERRIRHFLR